MTSYSIQQLPLSERPRERLQRHGPEAISSVDLIAIILGTGTKTTPVLQLAQEVVARFGNVQKVAEATIEELCAIKGLGFAKAVQLKAAFSLGVRAAKQSTPARYRIDNPIHAYHLVKEELEHETREIFVVILQDTKGCAITHQTVSIGTLDNALIHPREIFYPAIRHKAASIILAHNHPSGDPTPSKEDFTITKTLVEAGKLIDIPVNDHLIIGHQQYVSMRQQGFAFT